MRPLMYAIGVLNVSLDSNGQVWSLDCMRASNYAPEVIAEIERTLRAAAPYLAAPNMCRVTYTDN